MDLKIKNVFSCAYCGNLTTAMFEEDQEFVCKLKMNEQGKYDRSAIVSLNRYCGDYYLKQVKE